jgi:hypothetical protein
MVQSQHLSTPRSQGYLGAVARAKDVHRYAMDADHHIRSTAFTTRLQEKERAITRCSTIVLAFDANVKEVYAHSAIVWAMEHALKRGDTLAIVAVCGSVRGPLGYRTRIGDEKWRSANRVIVEHEIRQKLELWTAFPGLQYRCNEGGVKLLVAVKAAQRPEVAIVKEAVHLNATHVILDKSLKTRRGEFYVANLSCGVTRMRRSGGVEIVRVPDMSPAHELAISMQPKRASTSRLSTFSTTGSSMQSRRSCSSYFTEHDDSAALDDDLFSIFHFGSPTHDLEFIDTVLRGYDSDEGLEILPEALTQTVISRLTFVVGLGECVEIHLRSALRQGEGVLVGASPSALFLLQQGDARSRVVSAGSPASYIAMEGGMTMRLAHVECDQRVVAVDPSGHARTIAVRHAITQPQPLVLVEATSCGHRHSVILHHSQSLSWGSDTKSLCVKSLKLGNRALLRLRSWHQP